MTEKEMLFEKNIGLVYSTIRRFYPNCKGDEDVEQVAMLAYWKACANYTKDKTFSTYCISRIRKAISNYLKKERNQVETVNWETKTSDDGLALEEIVGIDDDLSHLNVSKDLRCFRETLNESYKELLDWKIAHLDGSNEECAKTFDINVPTARVRMSRLTAKWNEWKEANDN